MRSLLELLLSSCSDQNTQNHIIFVNGQTTARIVDSVDIVIYFDSKNNLKYVNMNIVCM